MRLLFALILSMIAGAAQAQNPTCPTRPAGQSDNSCASTAFVQQNPLVSISAFGGKGDNSTDNTAALNAALASGSGCNSVYFPNGKYRFNSGVTYSLPSGICSVSLLGGGQDATILTWPGGSGGIAFTYSGLSSSTHVRDLSVTTGTTSGGIGLNLLFATGSTSSADTAISDVTRVTFRGDDGYGVTDFWTTALNVQNVSNVQFDTVTAIGPSGINGNGIGLSGGSGGNFSVVYNIHNSAFILLAAGIIYGTNIQGVTVDQSNFTGGGWGIIANGSETNLAQLSVTNSQFNPATTSTGGIGTASNISGVQIANSFFIPSANTIGIDLALADQFTLVGNEIGCSSTTGSTGILIGTTLAGSKGTISGNLVTGCGTGINLQAAAAGTFVGQNVLTNNSAQLTNSSAATTNVVRDNLGFNPVGTSSATYAPATTATYQGGPSPETSYLTGGTVTAVKIPNNAGTTVCTTTPCTIDLGPNETFSVTYTGAPTQTKSVH